MTTIATRPSRATTSSRTPAPDPRTPATVGLVAFTLSAALMVHLHIATGTRFSPLDTTMSDYVYSDLVGWMFTASVLCLGVGVLAVVRGLSAARLTPGPLPKLGLWLTIVGSALVAVFPTDLGDVEPLSPSAEIHRYAAGVVFFSVPVTALVIAAGLARAHGVALRRTAVVTLAVLACYLASRFLPLPAVIREVDGVAQRVLFVLELGVLAQLARLSLRQRAGPAHVR